MQPMISRQGGPLSGHCRVPGDKSISHRALMLAASSVGESRIRGLLEADDVRATAAALTALGAEIDRDARTGDWHVHGCGVGGLAEPAGVLDLGNSGTGVRLLVGLAASHRLTAFFTGDASLRRRPMGRVIRPLIETGASFVCRSGDRLPLAVRGGESPLPITYRLPVASAQVKSAILLAGLNIEGETTVIEPSPTRDHSERLLRCFGAAVTVEAEAGGGSRITLVGQPELRGRDVDVPGDVSSAAFPLVAAAVVPGSRVVLQGVGINPARIGLIETLAEMGAVVRFANAAELSGEPVADITIEAGPLRGVAVPPARVPAMIDEFPVLAVAAACANGTTRMAGLAELRVKESDRLLAIAEGLDRCGVRVTVGADWLEVTGDGGPPPGGGRVATHFDHRIAMAFLVLGIVSRQPVEVDDATAIATSFPGFGPLMNGLGAAITDVAR
jgi:3-phosphoshikimate 1-carboxyvinyltransferase